MQIGVKVPRPSSVKLLMALCLLAGLGCGGGKDKVVSVTGKVTHRDQPVAGIVVSFVPQAATETGVSTGTTDNEGQYELRVFKSGRRGAVVGAHKVWVSLPRKLLDPLDKEEKMSTQKRGKSFIEPPPAHLAEVLQKYGNLDKTPLTVEVTGDQPIDLKLD